jgi:hypothetical protein
MFVLARDLGMTRAELGRRMSGPELIAWQGLYLLEQDERERAEQNQSGMRRRG